MAELQRNYYVIMRNSWQNDKDVGIIKSVNRFSETTTMTDTTSTSTIINTLVTALDLIENNPSHWDQSNWHCGTSHCLAGFCDIVQNYTVIDLNKIKFDVPTSDFAIQNPKLNYLFKADNTLDYIRDEINYLTTSANITGYDSNGYDRYGYDSNGYDRYGYDSNGYDSNGYDRYGYDRYGYDSNGYYYDGYDRDVSIHELA
jgi:hypothetical protein